jgi:hypothetical protein
LSLKKINGSIIAASINLVVMTQYAKALKRYQDARQRLQDAQEACQELGTNETDLRLQMEDISKMKKGLLIDKQRNLSDGKRRISSLQYEEAVSRNELQEGKSAKRKALKELDRARQELAAAHEALTKWLYVKHLAVSVLNYFGIYTTSQYTTLLHPSNSENTQASDISLEIQDPHSAPSKPKRRLSHHYLGEARLEALRLSQKRLDAYQDIQQQKMASAQKRPTSAKKSKKVAPSPDPFHQTNLLLEQRMNSAFVRKKSVSPSQNIILTSLTSSKKEKKIES